MAPVVLVICGFEGTASAFPSLKLRGDATLREIGTIAGEKEARALADYLLTLNITTKLEPKPNGWAVWVHREERVPEARVALAEFEANPADPRFQSAAKTAKEIRKKTEKVEKDYRKRVKDFRERWEGAMYHRAPLAFGLIIASVIVTALMNVNWSLYERILTMLSFSVKEFDLDGQIRDTGFKATLHGQVWRLITPIFIHFGLGHLFFNMLGMRYLGERVEMRKGTWRFAVLVLVSAIASNIGESFMTSKDEPTAQFRYFGGMSGVVFAIAGYLWVKGHADPDDHLSLDQQSVNWMLGWFLLGIIAPILAGPNPPSGFPYNMANVAHGVGLAVGMLFGIMRF
jgi:GlpG protein